MSKIASINPATGKLLQSFKPHDSTEINRRLNFAQKTYHSYRRTQPADRAKRLWKVAEVLEANIEAYAKIMTLEMGKLLTEARNEVKKCSWNLRYYAENGERMLADEVVPTEAKRSFIRYQPLGPLLAIMPWNFPFWQLFRFAAPALMAGNVVLLKHASNVPQCALQIEEIFQKAGFDPGVFQTLLIGSDQTGPVIRDPRIAAITLTGSTQAGSHVAAIAGEEIKKTVMELGGSDPFIVFPSANLDLAVNEAVKARMINSGQSCIAAKRFLIADEIYSEFENKFTQKMNNLVMGDPMDPTTEVGPLATEAIRDGLDEQVKKTRAAGARVLTGGITVERPGFYYAPTVLTDIPPNAPAHKEELFGPVASCFRFRTLEEAVIIANQTEFGLGASVWTQEPAEQERMANELEAGSIFINSRVASDPRLPFGGVKKSGYGRELGLFGIREFLNVKTVYLG